MSTVMSPLWLAQKLTPPLFFAGIAVASAAILGAALYFQYFENLISPFFHAIDVAAGSFLMPRNNEY